MAVNSATARRLIVMSRWTALLGLFIWAGCASRDEAETTGTLQDALCGKTTLALSGSGTLLQLTATSPSCAAGETPEYRFYSRREGATTAYTELRGWGSSPTFAWQTSELPGGKYTLLVYSRATGSTASKESSASLTAFVGASCQTAAITATPASPRLPGTSVGLDASAACSANATPEYRFFVRQGSAAYEEIAGWSSSPHFQWDTSQRPAGPYRVLVYTRAAGNLSPFEGSSSLAYSLGDVCSPVSGTLSPALAAGLGSIVSISASAPCLYGTTAQYQFSYRATGASAWQLLAPWGPAALSWNTTGVAAGPLQILVEARASDYAGKAQSTKVLAYTLGPLCSAVSLVTSPKSPRPLGTTLTLTGAATCSAGSPAEYRFLYKDPLASDYRELAGWGSAASITWNTQQQLPACTGYWWKRAAKGLLARARPTRPPRINWETCAPA